jgi:L-asparagine transporter-like permease
MASTSTIKKSYTAAILLRLIPLLIGVVLLLIYKPANYGILLFAIIGAYVMAAIIILFAMHKARKGNQENA